MAGIDIISDSTGKEIVAAIQSTDVAQARILEINTAAEAKKNEVLESIPEDYSNIVKEVGELKGDLDDTEKILNEKNSVKSKNLFDKSTITKDKYVSNTDGTILSYTDWFLSDYIEIVQYSKYAIIKCTTTVYVDAQNSYYAFYDANKVFVSGGILQSGFIEAPETAKYIRISNEISLCDYLMFGLYDDIKFAYGLDRSAYVSFGFTSFKRLDALENPYSFPQYYDDYILKKEKTIREHYESSINGDSFVFITDYHIEDNTGHSPNLIHHIMKKSPIRFVCFNGDMINSESTKDGARVKILDGLSKFNYLKKEEFFTVMGNHEFNNPSASTSESDIAKQLSYADVYQIMYKSSENNMVSRCDNSYCIDNKIQKIRYIFFGCSYASGITTSQNVWFAETLMETPAGYSIIVFSHVSLKEDGSNYEERLDNIVRALKAFKRKTQYWYNDITYDYSSNNGDVIGVFGGHMHLDGYVMTQYSDGTNAFPFIATTCDSYSQEYGDLDRTEGTINEQAFDVVQIDTENRKIYMTRIGAGSDREFSY